MLLNSSILYTDTNFNRSEDEQQSRNPVTVEIAGAAPVGSAN